MSIKKIKTLKSSISQINDYFLQISFRHTVLDAKRIMDLNLEKANWKLEVNHSIIMEHALLGPGIVVDNTISELMQLEKICSQIKLPQTLLPKKYALLL